MNGKILIVDDNAQSVSLMTLLLQHAGCTVVSASCGAEGLKIARREPLDMILMDIQMPDMDGFRAAHEILADKNTRHIPVMASARMHRRNRSSRQCIWGWWALSKNRLITNSLLPGYGHFCSLARKNNHEHDSCD